MATRGDAHLASADQRGEPPARRDDPAACAADGGAVRVVGSGGRYCLVDRVSEAGSSTVWKAFDRLLGRPVTVRTFAPRSCGGADVIAAARAACRVSDGRLERIFDADVIAGSGYIVTEWPSGDRFDDILASGYVDVGWAARVIADAAAALGSAHAAGIAHQHLSLRSLRWSRESGVKITGLGVEAALAMPESAAQVAGGTLTPQQVRADTRALGRFLYAALTGHWPGPEHTVLPAAPGREGHLYRPRQVRAGVPARLDEITCRVLLGAEADDTQPITTPAQLAALLNRALKPQATEAARPVPDETAAVRGAGAPAASAATSPPRRRRRHALAGGLVGALFVIDSALIGVSLIGARHPVQVVHRVIQAPRPVVFRSHHPARALTPVSAQSFDPYGGGADENEQLAAATVDGDQSTAWHTFWYTTEDFGNLKPGTGLLLDMGRPMTISGARLLLGAVPGADVELRIGERATSLGDLAVVAKADDAGAALTLRPVRAHRGRYVLIWFTKLPPRGDGSGVYQASIYDVVVRGF